MIQYSDEQKDFINEAKRGKNILVDACIGSGKTTAIQGLCDELKDKTILYLTYNKLLKLDAKAKITNKNVTVQNYHGFAYMQLKACGVTCAVGQLIQTYNKKKPKCKKAYDVLILDEYQDIDENISKMLMHIKDMFPKIQIVAVGDMEQKIYDYTSLDVMSFMESFLGDYTKMSFSRCFRLNKDIAKQLGDAWHKPIIGVNENCKVEIKGKNEVISILKDLEPRDILCLGARYGDMVDVLNRLEHDNREKFNKFTVYASIQTQDRGRVDPRDDVAIFTTFDSSKGLERKVCVVFDYDDAYWTKRKSQPDVKYDILRNIFLVAASRGKERIIFCTNKMLEFDTIAEPFDTNQDYSKHPLNMSGMFDYKYIEDINRAFSDLDVKEVKLDDCSEIKIKSHDGLIDMSPCIGIFTEACYFKNFSIDDKIEFQLRCDSDRYNSKDLKELSKADLIKKIRYSTYLSTQQRRYYTQSSKTFVTEEGTELIRNRLSKVLPNDCATQRKCSLKCKYIDKDGEEKCINILGMTDAFYDDVLYEIKFTSEISHEHFLQLASYMVALDIDVGRIWNIRYNKMFEVRIKNRTNLLNHIIQAVTKGTIKEFVEV